MIDDPCAFNTDDIDLAAFIAARGRKPSVYRQAGHQRATFSFPRDREITSMVEAYATGEAMVSARALLAARRGLFHRVRDLERGGGL